MVGHTEKILIYFLGSARHFMAGSETVQDTEIRDG
jgi:hypothetical protein